MESRVLRRSSSPRKKDGRQRLLLGKQDDNVIVLDTDDDQSKKRKRILDDDNGDGEKRGRQGGGKKLEELCKRLCPKQVTVDLYPINFKEIEVTTPSKGLREIYYCGLPSDSESDYSSEEDDEDDEKEKDKKRKKARYEDWRCQTIRAFPSSSTSSTGKQQKKKTETDSKKEDNESKRVCIEIPSTHDFIFNVNYAKDDLHSIMDLLTGWKTSTCVVDGYLMLCLKNYYKEFYEKLNRRLIKKSVTANVCYTFRNKENRENDPPEDLSQTPINFQYLSVNFMPVEDREQLVSTFVPNLKFLPDLTKLQEGSNAQLICPLYASSHLYLAVFDFREKCVNAYDSSWHYLPMELREGQIQVILRAVTKHNEDQSEQEDNEKSNLKLTSLSDWKVNFIQTSCPQYDEYSCGIYTIYYAENVIRGIAHSKNRWKLSDRRVVQIRRKIAKELLSTTSAGRRLLQALTE